MTQKNFFNTENATESRSVTTGDLPWTDDMSTLAPNWTPQGQTDSVTINETAGGIVHIVDDSNNDGNAGGDIRASHLYGSFDIQVDFNYTLDRSSPSYRHKAGIHLNLYDGSGGAGGLYVWFSQRDSTDIPIIGYQGNNPSWTLIPEGTIAGDSDFTGSGSTRNNKLRIQFNQGTNTFTFSCWNYGNSTWVGTTNWVPTWTFGSVTQVLCNFGNWPQIAAGTAIFNNWTINSADAIHSAWTDEFPNPLADALFYDKFEGGSETITTEFTPIPYTDDFTTDPYLNQYDYYVTDRTLPQFNGYITYDSVNDWMNFDVSPGTNIGYWNHDLDFKFSSDFQCEWEFQFNVTTGMGAFTSEVSARTPDGNDGIRFYVGQSDGRVFKRVRLNGGSWDLASTGLVVNTGSVYRFRLTRVGHVVTFTYSENSGTWTEPTSGNHDFTPQIGVGTYSLSDWDVNTYHGSWTTISSPVNLNYRSFKVNSATGGAQYVPEKVESSPEVPTENWWIAREEATSADEYAKIVNDEFRFDFPSDGVERSSAYAGNFTLSGDFDVQIDWDYTTLTTPSTIYSYACEFNTYLSTDGSNVGYINRGKDDFGNDKYTSAGADAAFDGVTTTDTSGTNRIVRVGGVVTVYYWSGSQWEWGGDTNGRVVSNNQTGNVELRIGARQRPDGHTETALTNFVINSCDKIVWAGGTLKKFVEQTGTTYNQTFDSDDDFYSFDDPTVTGAGAGVIIGNGEAVFDMSSSEDVRNTTEMWYKPHLNGSFSAQVDYRHVNFSGRTGTWKDSCGLSVKLYKNSSGNPIGHIAMNTRRESIVPGGDFKFTAYSVNYGTILANVDINASGTNSIDDNTLRFEFTKGGTPSTSPCKFFIIDNGIEVQAGPTFYLLEDADYAEVFMFSDATNVVSAAYFDNFQGSADSITWNGAGSWTPTYMNRFGSTTVPQDRKANFDAVGTIGQFPSNYSNGSIGNVDVVINADGESLDYRFLNTSGGSSYAGATSQNLAADKVEPWAIVQRITIDDYAEASISTFWWTDVRINVPELARLSIYWDMYDDEVRISLDRVNDSPLNQWHVFNLQGSSVDQLYLGVTSDGANFTVSIAETETSGEPNWYDSVVVPMELFASTNTGDWYITERLQTNSTGLNMVATREFLDASVLVNTWNDSILKRTREYTDNTYSDDFDRPDGTELDPVYWTVMWDSPEPLTIYNNRLEWDNPSGIFLQGSHSNFHLRGDFDVSMDFGCTTPFSDGTNSFSIALGVRDVDDIAQGIVGTAGFQYSDSNAPSFRFQYFAGDSTTVPTGANVPDGKFRVTRISGVIYEYYWNGSSWTLMNTRSGGQNMDVVVVPSNYAVINPPPFAGFIDNLSIQADEIIWNGIGSYEYVGNV